MTEEWKGLEAAIGITFSDERLLREALTHSSFSNENPDSTVPPNERLEFLGDAILDYVTADYLFRRFPEMHEGEMTALRAAVVKTSALADYALKWDLGRYLLLGKGEEGSGGRERLANLCAAFEALIGAIYLDQGMATVRTLVTPLIADDVSMLLKDEMLTDRTDGFLIKDAKSRLQELAQSLYHLTPSYRTVNERGPDHEKEFTVEVLIGSTSRGCGAGRSKQAAEQAAAREALAWMVNEEANKDGSEPALSQPRNKV